MTEKTSKGSGFEFEVMDSSRYWGPALLIKTKSSKDVQKQSAWTSLSFCPHIMNVLIILATDAAEVLRSNRRLFEQNVQKAMRGGFVGSVYFDRTLK